MSPVPTLFPFKSDSITKGQFRLEKVISTISFLQGKTFLQIYRLREIIDRRAHEICAPAPRLPTISFTNIPRNIKKFNCFVLLFIGTFSLQQKRPQIS